MKLPWHSLSAPARRALVCHALYWQAMSLAIRFVDVYLFRLGHGYRDPAYYQAWANGTITFGFMLGAVAARRWSSAACYRIGLVLFTAFLFTVLLLKERCSEFIPLIGSINGLATGFYWLGWILLIVDLAEDSRRDAMLGTQQWVFFLSGLTGAPLAGWFLASYSDLGGYHWIFIAATAMMAAAWWISLPLRTPALHGSGSLKRLLRAKKPRGFWGMNLSSALMGLLSVAATFLTALIAYERKGDESGTGNVSLLSAALGFAATWWIARRGNPQNRLKTMLVSALVVAAVTLPLAFNRSYSMVALYSAGMALALGFFNPPLFGAHLKIVSENPRLHLRRADVLTIRETFVNTGRVAGYLFVMLAVGNVDSRALGAFFIVIALTPILNTYVMRRYV